MSEASGGPKRVRVTSPRRTASRRGPVRPAATEVRESTALGELYVDSLVRAQLRLSVTVVTGVFFVLGALPAIVIYLPWMLDHRIGPVPVAWLLLAVMLYPFYLLVAYTYVRSAEWVERDFTDLMGRE